MTFSVILATTGMIQLHNHVDLKYIFILIGSVVLLSASVLLFGIKDTHLAKRQSEEVLPQI
jgi:hypothetical protein